MAPIDFSSATPQQFEEAVEKARLVSRRYAFRDPEFADEIKKERAARRERGTLYRTADEIMAEIAAEKAAAEARIEAWKASLKANRGGQS